MPTGQFMEFCKFVDESSIGVQIKISILDSGTYFLNIVDISNKQLRQLEENIQFILNNYLKIIETTSIFRKLLCSFSRRNKKRIWKQVVNSMPIHYYLKYFPAFLTKPVGHYLVENDNVPAPGQSIAMEIAKYNNFIESQILFFRLKEKQHETFARVKK